MNFETITNNNELEDGQLFENNIERSVDKADRLIQTIGQEIENFNKSNPEHAKRFREKLVNKLKTYSQILSLAISLTGIGLAANYERTKYEVTENTQDGSVEYTHEDEETTQIIDYLSGKKDLPRDAKLRIVKNKIMHYLNYDSNFISPKNWKELSESDFKEQTLEFLKKDTDKYKEAIKEIDNENWLDIFMPEYKINKPLYKSLWSIEKTSGNPKIRWEVTDKSYARIFIPSVGFIAYYNPISNTIYISSEDRAIDDMVAEASHAVQFRDKPVSSIFKELKTIKEAMEHGYDAVYNIPGTIEHEAHSIIEPKLKAMLDE